MSNSYKNIIKNFAHKLNEQQMPVQQSEEKVKLTQAEKAPLKFTWETASDMLYNGNMPQTIELDNGKILKYVGSLKDQIKGKVENADNYEFIIVYADENDPNKKYIVYDWDEDRDGLTDIAAESWAKRFESGALPPDAIEPYWWHIIYYGDTLKFLDDSNAASAIAKTIASLKLDAKKAKQTAEALWGPGSNSKYPDNFKDIIKDIASDDSSLPQKFLTSDTNGVHTIKGDDDDFFAAMRYEFEV